MVDFIGRRRFIWISQIDAKVKHMSDWHEITLSIPEWIGGSAVEDFEGWAEFTDNYPTGFVEAWKDFHLSLYDARDDMELSPVKIDKQFIQNNSGLFYDAKNQHFLMVQQFPDDDDAVIIGFHEEGTWRKDDPVVWDTQPFSSEIYDIVGFDFGEKSEVYMVLSLMTTAPLLNWLKPKVLESILEV